MSEELKVLSMVWGTNSELHGAQREKRHAYERHLAAFLKLAFGHIF